MCPTLARAAKSAACAPFATAAAAAANAADFPATTAAKAAAPRNRVPRRVQASV